MQQPLPPMSKYLFKDKKTDTINASRSFILVPFLELEQVFAHEYPNKNLPVQNQQLKH